MFDNRKNEDFVFHKEESTSNFHSAKEDDELPPG